MKPSKKAALLILLSSASILNSSANECQYPNSAMELLSKCDRALSDCDKLLGTKDSKIRTQGEIIQTQDEELVRLRARDQSILRSPILWFAIGAAATGLTIGIAGRR